MRYQELIWVDIRLPRQVVIPHQYLQDIIDRILRELLTVSPRLSTLALNPVATLARQKPRFDQADWAPAL